MSNVVAFRNGIGRSFVLSLSVLLFAACGGSPAAEPPNDDAGLPYDRIGERIASRLSITRGERVLIGHEPTHLPELTAATRKALIESGATVELHAYGAGDDFEKRLQASDIYIWLPFSRDTGVPALLHEFPIAARWVLQDNHRQIHFHWGDGTRSIDGMQGVHSADFDAVYVDALDIDYHALDARMREAESALRAGQVRVTTPAGTDIRFRIAQRPVTIQAGDASLEAVRGTTLPIQREIELPAGALRAAPVEESVSGVMVVPYARLLANPWERSDAEPAVRNLRLRFEEGQLIEMTADEGAELFQAFLDKYPALNHFREFALGFNPELRPVEGSEWLPYYGYGAGVVRLSIGNNQELGGAVTGDGIRWFLFPDATVTLADGRVLVRDGSLQNL